MAEYNNRGNCVYENSETISERFQTTLVRVRDRIIPKLSRAYNNRGNAYMKKPWPSYKQAISDYTRAIELDPYYLKAYNSRSLCIHEKAKSRL